MKYRFNKQNIWKWLLLLAIALGVGVIVYAPAWFRFIQDGIIYSGNGDGFKQMMPFQMFLYEHFSQFPALYDLGFGLGGDFFTDLAYYYSTSPLMYLNFGIIGLTEWLTNIQPEHIEFWPGNQIFLAFIKCVITFLVAYGTMREFKLFGKYRFLGAFLYSASSVLYYFNFTWSFFGDILIYLPLSIWGMERFFKQRKIGLFIIAIALTLFSNFYFSYYEMIVLSFYLVYRMISPHRDDIVRRWQKLILLIPATLISLMIGSIGFFTGVKSFLNNDRQSNEVFFSPIIDYSQKYHIFTNGFYITLSFIVLVALFSFKLYRHYYFKLFAIATWVLLIGSFSLYFDSFFNGFSFPQRRWVYILAFSSSVLVALWLKHITALTWKDYRISIYPIVILLVVTLFTSRGEMWWMICAALILMILGYYVYQQKHIPKVALNSIIGLFIVQQFVLLINYHDNNIAPYQSTMKDMQAPDYHSQTLQRNIDQITQNQSPFERIDYMSTYSVNSSMIYGFNGVSLYSSIFDGHIMDYYDKLLQINMEYDSNSTYRLLGDRANLYALWNVSDRIKEAPDSSQPYGMEKQKQIKDGDTLWDHSANQVQYPSAHLTSKVYDPDQLKTPIDREHAMLNGIISDDIPANSSIQKSENLLSQASITPRNAKRVGNILNVQQDDGGLDISLPEQTQSAYKDYYIEMDVELNAPNKQHYLEVNDFHQKRSKLDYAYRRFVTPVTVRVPVDDQLQLKLAKGLYRVNIKGIYGEDYKTLNNAKENVQPVKVKEHARYFDVKMAPTEDSYLVLPMPYREGLTAEVDGQSRNVEKTNGLMTMIPVHKGESNVKVSYQLPYIKWLAIITVVGILAAFVYRWWLRRNNH